MDFNRALLSRGAERVDRLVELLRFLKTTDSLTADEEADLLPMIERQHSILRAAETGDATLEDVVELTVLNARVAVALGLDEAPEGLGQVAG